MSCENCERLAYNMRLLSQYARELETNLMPELFIDEPELESVNEVICGPPVSDTETYEREPEDLDQLRHLLQEAEAVRDAAMNKAWRLRCRIQDEELRLRWASRNRLAKARAWVPPALVAEGAGGANGVAVEQGSAPPVPPSGMRPIESIAELAGKPRRRRAR